MGWIVYSKDGQTEKCVLHKLEYSGTFMGDRTVIATFSSEKKIDFSVFDYITYRGERFELELLPTVKKVSSYEYKYELRFVSLKYELERCMMRNIVPGDNGIVYPTPLSVEFTGDVKYLAERIQACLDAMYGKGAWSITIAESTESEEKNISMSNQNCWDALSLVNTEYKLNYFIKGRNVIIGGEEPVVDNVFEYGKGKGLYEIERISDTDTGVVTKLRAYGGTRNLDYSYPKLPDWEDSVLPANYALSPLRLMLPSFKADGKTDYVLASEEAIAKYGIREGTITYDDIYPSITGMKNSSGQAIDEIKSVSAITNETQPTFTVGLYDLGFDLNESLTTDEAQMSMKSGSLQGYTFNITKIERASDGSYTLTLGRNTLEKEDTGNFTVPNKDWNMKAGDKFVLLNILMPQAYIRDAENRLLARAKEYLAKYSSTNYSYNVGVDEIFMARNVNFYNDIMEGKRLTVNDQEIGINNENIIIQSLTIKEGEGIVPTFEVTLNNETTASTLDRIQGQISEVETSVSNNFSSQSELLKQYRKKLDKSVWDSIFVIHKDDSENPEKITSVQSLVGLWTNEFLSAKGLNPGSGGGSGEGGATALYQLNDVAKNASETGVLGAGPGKVLTYGIDGKWYAADAVGLDETALGKYLTDNNYAQKSDIPSLSGYATQSWVLGKNYITSDALSGYATQSWVNSQGYATASSLKAVSDKLNDFLEGSDTDGIINKWKELEAFLAGQTQTSTLADLLAVKADKATTLSGYGITDAYTKTEVNTKLGSYVTTTALNTALAKKVDVAFLAKVFGFIGEDSSEVSINDMGSVITSIKAKFGLWTDEYLSSKGLNPNAGGGSGEGATALYQLNDVSQNASGTGVLGAEAGKVLTYGSDGKWYAAKAGMDEDALSSYLTENNYAQKSDIPSLNGYATQSWVNTALEKKVDKVSGMGLSHNDFTDTLLQKLNGIAEGANKYILPIAKAAVLGGVMIGSTLTASATGVLDLPEVAVAGTYAKVTTDVYGRVTAGSSLSASDIPALGISKITGLQAALDNKVNKADFVTEFDKAMQRWFVRDTANKGLHPADYDSEAVGIYSDSYMSAKGVNTGAGGSAGGASSLGELNNVGSWADDIPTVDRIMVQRKGATHWESLNLNDIGLNETQLSDYLTTNNYAKKSDIPSLSGYATQAWVNTKLADYATTSSVTTLLAEKVDKVEGKGLSANDFTDTLLNKLNGIEAGANKYVLPTASGSVLGGVKVGTTLSIANGVLNLKSGIATAGTYTKVTVDTYGRVVSGDSLVSGDIPTLAISKISGLQTALDDKANKDGSNATGTWGISITGSSRRLYQAPLTNEDLNDYTYANHSGKMYYAGGGNTTVNSPSDAYGLMVWRIAAGYTGQIGFGSNNNLYKRRIDNNGVATGWMRIVDEGNFSTILDTRYVTKTFLARLFGAMDADGNEIAINNTSTVIDSIKAKVGLWTEQYLSSKGLNPNAGSGEGSDYNRLDAWDDYSTDKSGYVLSAGLGWDLNTRVSSLESKAITLTTSGTGNGLSGFTQNGNTVTFSKATFLTEHQSLAGYATESWVNNKGYLVATSADKANWNTAFGWGDHSKAGYATQLWVTSKDYATIADLDARINALVNGAPEAFDTLKEIADVLQGNVNQIEDLLTAIGTKADKTITISAGTGLNGGGTLAANRTINLSAATTKALGGIIVGDRLSIDSDGKLSATYTYTLPTASASVLGGVKVGTTLAISSGVLNLKAVGTAGTYFKTTTDAYGRVTAGSNPTTLAGFGITDGVNDVAYSGSGNAVTSATVSGHIITLVKGTTFLTKATFDDLFEKVNIGTASAPVYAIKAKYGLYTEQFLSSMGLNLGTGSGGGSDYDRLDTWADYDASKAGWVLSAGLGNDLNTRVKSLEGGSALTVKTSGSGNAVTSVDKAGTLITVTKGTTFVDTTNPQTIGGSKTFSSSILMGRSNLHYVNNSTTNNATGLYWKTANYAATQFGIGCFTTNNASPRAFIGWTSEPWTTSNNLTVSETQLTYKAKNILHAGNYNDYAPTKTGGGASGSWGINITGNAATATTSSMLTVKDVRGESRLPSYFEEKRVTSWFNNTGNPISAWFSGIHVKGWTDSYMSWELATNSDVTSTVNNSLYYRNGLGSTWHAWRAIIDSYNYTSYVLKIGTATVGGTAKPIYLNAGTPTALSSTVGDSTVPAYLNAGTVTVCSWGLSGASGKRARKSGYITSSTASLSSYWGKIASFNWGDASGERDITLYIHSAFNSLWGTVVIRTRWSSATSTVIDFRIINGNIPTSRLRLYYDVSAKDNVITLWGDVNAQWGAFNTYVLSETTRTSSETGDVTLYTTSFTTAQTLPTSTYKTPTYLSILNNADTATTLQTSRTIFGKSFNGSANVAGQALVYGTYQETASSRYSNGGIQVRENGMVGSAQTADGYAPAIGFHWANRIGASLILTTSGFKFMNQAFTGYQNVYGIFKGNADSATQVYSTLTNPTTGTWYVIPFHTGASTANKSLLNNNGIQYYSLEGTASAQGEALIQLGNSTATGTAGNKRGRLRLYSSSSGWADFTLTATTGNYTLTLPAATGTVALTSSNVASATKLQTARTLWGQSFNGTANVSGSMTGVGPNIVAAANITVTTTGEGNNLSLKYNNDDTKSVVLNTSAFKPFDLATNKLNLGTSAARWLGLYANTGNFSSTVTGTRFISTVATGTAPLTVSSTTMVTNLNAQMVGGIGVSNIPLEYDANYIPSGTAARWLRIAYFDYTGASYSWSGTFTITNSYSNNENTGIIFNVTTRHTTTSANVTPNITQVSGNSNIFTSIRLVKDTSTTYANVYLEVYYNSTSAGNRVYVSYKPANRSIGKWSLYSTYTAGSVPDNHTVIAQVTTTDGFATNQNIRAQGYLYVAGNATFNNRLIIQSDGKIVPYSTATRRSGVYGVYDSAKIGHIWSMGSAYQIADDGSNFGSLYGFAYKHTNNTTGGTMASGHQAVWCENGVPKVAIGSNLWVANNATISAALYTDTLTIKNTEAVGHIKFSRGSYNYITAPTSGLIAFVVNGLAVGAANSSFILEGTSLHPGTTNVITNGTASFRWSNTYTQLLNVAGVATLSSTVNIAGVLNANNATDATSTTAAGAVFDGGVGIAKQLRVGGNVTIAGNVNFANSGQLSVPYTGGQWISMATRTNLIVGKENTSEASAHALYRVKSFAGDAVVFGGLKNSIGFYGFYKARIDSGDNGSDWATTWNTTTGTLTHNKAMTVSGAVTFNSTLTVASTATFSSTTDATSTTAAAVKVTGGLGVAKQLRVGGAVTLSSTLAVTSTSTFTGKTTHNGGIGATTGTFSSTLSAAGVVSFTNATDATSTTAAAVKITGGLGIAKQLRVGGASTFSGTINTSVATFIKLGANATDQRILKDVDGNGFYSGISFFGTKGSNMGVSDIMMNIYAGGAIQIHSQAGSGQILLNGTVHNNVGMYSDGYMSSKGLNDTSDMRLKNKGRDIFLSVKDMAHAPAFEYTWKDGTPGVMVGSSAQYWQKVLPPSVKIKKDGYMTMFYGHTALVATISLARHVETLEERVERLERENKEKDKRIKELERRISA